MDLGTSRSAEEIYRALGEVGFDLSKTDPHLIKPYNIRPRIESLNLTACVHPPCHHKGVPGIETEIQYNADYGPYDSKNDRDYYYSMVDEHVEILRELSRRLPDLVYFESYKEWFDANNEERPKIPRLPVDPNFFEGVERIKSRKK